FSLHNIVVLSKSGACLVYIECSAIAEFVFPYFSAAWCSLMRFFRQRPVSPIYVQSPSAHVILYTTPACSSFGVTSLTCVSICPKVELFLKYTVKPYDSKMRLTSYPFSPA